MPAGDPVAREELPPARPRKADDVLDVGSGRSHCSHRRRVERPADDGERQNAEHATGDLEPARGDVLVRHTVAKEVEHRPHCGRTHPRAGQDPADSSRGNVK
jgi:hypothetical protein